VRAQRPLISLNPKSRGIVLSSRKEAHIHGEETDKNFAFRGSTEPVLLRVTHRVVVALEVIVDLYVEVPLVLEVLRAFQVSCNLLTLQTVSMLIFALA
jgi:hypothetical protein